MQADCHCTTLCVMHSNHRAHKAHTHKHSNTHWCRYTHKTFQTTIRWPFISLLSLHVAYMVCFMELDADLTYAGRGHILRMLFCACLFLHVKQWKGKDTININIYSCVCVWVHMFHGNCGTRSTHIWLSPCNSPLKVPLFAFLVQLFQPNYKYWGSVGTVGSSFTTRDFV